MESFDLLRLPNVVGYGQGFKVTNGRKTERLATVVLVTEKLPLVQIRTLDLIPRQLDGFPTDVVPVGIIRALQGRTAKWRPAPGGVSIGHYAITAGTLGVIVRDTLSQDMLILSNNHVLANSNAGRPDDRILQPGPVDGGREDDQIAELRRFVPIMFNGASGSSGLLNIIAAIGNALASVLGDACRLKVECPEGGINVVDAAVAEPLTQLDVADYIFEIGSPRSTKRATLGMSVRKSGRTTGLTFGEVQLLDAVVQVSYGAGKVATFERQIVTSNMSKGGDSGSLLVDAQETKAVGLLFAGSDQVTIHNPIDEVLELLEIML